jgi:hypothetical protein
MISFEPVNGTDPLNLPTSILQACAESMNDLLLNETGDFQDLSRRREATLDNPRVFFLQSAPELAILNGLCSSFLGKQPREHLRYGYIFEFFAYYFLQLWTKATDTERRALRGKLVKGLKDHRHLASLFFELVTGFAYLKKGCNVHFLDIEPQAEGSFDMLVGKNGLEYAIEVKTVDSRTGMPFNSFYMSQCISELSEFLTTKRERWAAYIAEIKYIGPRQPKLDSLQLSIRHIISQLEKGSNRATNEFFDVDIAQTDPWIPEAIITRYVEGESRNAMDAFLLQALSPASAQPGLLRLTSKEPWSLKDKISTVISDALKRQLRSKHPAVLWIQIVGSSSGTAADLNQILALMDGDSKIVREVRNIQRKASQGKCAELVGVHLASDPYAFAEEGRATVGLQQHHIFCSTKVATQAVNLYQFGVMNMLPSQLAGRF